MKMKSKERIEFLVVIGVALAVILVGREFLMSGSGENAEEPAVVEILDSNQRVATGAPNGASTVLSLARGERSDPIRVGSNQCIQWWDAPSGSTGFRVEVAGFDGNDWISNDEFQQRKTAGTADYNFPAWYRFVGARDGATEVPYQILGGRCPG